MDSLTLSTGTLLFKSIPTKFEKESIYSYNLLDSKTEKCKHASWFGLTHDKAEYYRKKIDPREFQKDWSRYFKNK